MTDVVKYFVAVVLKLFLLFFFQPNFPDVDMPERDPDFLPIDTTSSQAPEVASAPKTADRTLEYIRRIADLKDRVKFLKRQVISAMDQTEKSPALSQKVSSLEDEMSVLMSKSILVDIYMC
jgi:hypothetical protein